MTFWVLYTTSFMTDLNVTITVLSIVIVKQFASYIPQTIITFTKLATGTSFLFGLNLNLCVT